PPSRSSSRPDPQQAQRLRPEGPEGAVRMGEQDDGAVVEVSDEHGRVLLDEAVVIIGGRGDAFLFLDRRVSHVAERLNDFWLDGFPSGIRIARTYLEGLHENV